MKKENFFAAAAVFTFFALIVALCFCAPDSNIDASKLDTIVHYTQSGNTVAITRESGKTEVMAVQSFKQVVRFW
jgi:ABC-type enterochelin transport system substrate-binding protein